MWRAGERGVLEVGCDDSDMDGSPQMGGEGREAVKVRGWVLENAIIASAEEVEG